MRADESWEELGEDPVKRARVWRVPRGWWGRLIARAWQSIAYLKHTLPSLYPLYFFPDEARKPKRA
jgi:hypothetical protein